MNRASGHPDLAIVGGGIIGLATALIAQSRDPAARIMVLEREPVLASHQTGRNSGVIHAGVYYAPGSLKAHFCRDGAAMMRDFCAEHDIPTETCGKLIVATSEAELHRMQTLFQRARENGIRIEELSGPEARQLEPNILAQAALLSPDTGIVDFQTVARRMADLFTGRGGEIRTGVNVTGGRDDVDGLRLDVAGAPSIHAGRAVFCCGLWADRMARAMGADADFRIVPFRGEYFRIQNQPPDLVRHLIYPVPDPARPFLGIHLTRKLDGSFTAGPNAVLAMARAGYRHRDINPRDLAEALLWPGFWRLLVRNAGAAAGEFAASLSRGLYLRKVQKYCPRIGSGDLAPYRAGVRAQAVAPDGRLIDDFLFARTPHSIHVCNAPSPAATASLAIADHVLDTLDDKHKFS